MCGPEAGDRLADTHFVVLATDVGGVGGIQRATRMLLTVLTERWGQQRVRVVAVSGASPASHELPGAPPPTERRRRVPLLAQAAYLAAAVGTARRWRHRDLIVIACHVHLAPVAWAASIASGAPYGICCYGIEAWGMLNPLVRLSLRRATVVSSISRFSATCVEAASGMSPGTVQVVPLGLSPELVVHANGPAAMTVVTVARLDPSDAYKGVDVLIRAWPRVVSEVPDAELIVVGDGADRARLAAQADALRVTSRVRFAGHLSDDDLAGVYSRARAFALPSRYTAGRNPEGEGFGLVFVEAGAAGLPVVAGSGGASEEVVPGGVSGLLVDPKDEHQVALAVTRLLTDPELARRLGAEGQARAARLFSFDAYREAVSRFVDRLREGARKRTCAESSVS